MDRANGAGLSPAASRAERFEDEKRRIIESCFSKKEDDGSLLETYITHIRITEYASHPSSPPPPHARSSDSEKPRVIIVAVRRSGRVRMHKSKENASGTFSIGKSWNLDDLSHIESFTGSQVNPNYREWAGDTGFLVTLGKPYFWHAQTDKEKKFFVASLIKIYGKYTGGRLPDLAGFDQKELEQVLGAGRRHPAVNSRSPITETAPSHQSISSGASAAPSPSTILPPSNSSTPEPTRFQKPPPAVRPPLNGGGSPAASSDSIASRERPPAPRWTAQNNKSQDSVANSFATRSDDASLPPRSRNGIGGPGAYGRFGDSREPPELPQDGSAPHLEDRPPPERRRPPMDPSRPQDRDLVPPPLMSPNARREPVPPPPRSTDRVSSRKNAGPGAAALTGGLKGRDAPAPLETSMIAEPPLPDQARAGKGAADTSMPTTPAADTPPPAETSPGQERAEEEMRPGLGPMIKAKRSKGDLAGALWKAASAAAAFRPRPGGAGDRLRQPQGKGGVGPDGITGVVPAPPRPASRDQGSATPDVGKPDDDDSHVPEVKVTASESGLPATADPSFKEDKKKKEEPGKEEPRRSVVAGNDVKSEEFGKWLDYFGWVPGQQMRSQSMDDVRADIERELNKAQAGGWLARFQDEDERVDAIKRGIDLAISECEEMDNLLTLYAVELSTLSDDIAYIEAQGQGLQVQTANQKLLKKELESLLETCAITSNDLEALRVAPLENMRGLEDVEFALVTLFKAMIKIDPTLGGHEAAPTADATMDSERVLGLNSDYGNMRIVQEKKEMYLQESAYFMRRLIEFMARQFDEAFAETRRSLEGALSKKGDSSNYDAGRDILWKYSPLMLYARDVDLDNWNRLLQIYQDKGSPLYKSQVQNVVAVLRRNARKPTGEEADLLFSSQRSQTLARALRSPLADGGSRTNVDKAGSDGGCHSYEVFCSVLDDVLPLVEMEQNFVIDFFHATTLEQVDFPDAVAARSPRDRRGGDLRRHRLMEPDRDLARRVTRSMEVIFVFLESELQRMMEWVIGQDPLQGIGVLAVLEKKLSEMGQSNQDYVNTLLQKLHGLLEGRFRKFVDEQIRAIEETKVKVNKRRGVISFIRVFPAFAAAIESMLVGMDANLGLRRTVDREYDRILKSMFDSLMVIAREHPAVGVTSGAADPEDKEALNFHILLIENMNHFLEETDTRGLELLEEWKEQANTEYHEHMGLYINAVMRRPLGKLLDQLENIEAQLQTGKSAEAIARQPSNSKAIFNKVLSYYDSKEVRKGIEALRKRVEKHFGDADDPALSRGLVLKVTRECELFYHEVESRIGRVTTDVYGGEVPFEWPRADVKAAFR
ncbi:exocyst complex component sec3 domain-containing protein [Hirsutella rhossiliensis]|uniref:Exocyst complex component sec3 domain-containing protein n=1 Tax=Hirsutella rhossiliensis TaxID=111463 RepID=A0A9P8MND8_9HYPO|nr:exocyst complex component sec3 domain-containing protein [Hirsutella rhossiliensis]KAH0958598.1 exocyst complex component sec3 domain-containing protein [Hirsutella rhossiliensis]